VGRNQYRTATEEPVKTVRRVRAGEKQKTGLMLFERGIPLQWQRDRAGRISRRTGPFVVRVGMAGCFVRVGHRD
jgi:hypothetical protein